MCETKIAVIVLLVGMLLWPAGVVKADLPDDLQADPVFGSYIFRRASGNSTYDLSSQFTVTVSGYNDPDPNAPPKVLFTFWNDESGIDNPIPSSITDIYFDDGALLAMEEIVNSNGVQFSLEARPRNLSGGSGMTPPFETTKGFSVDSDSPVSQNGIGPGEWLGIAFTLQDNMTVGDVDLALLAGTNLAPDADPDDPMTLRIGIHVQGLPDDDESDLYVQHVPVPGAAIMGMLGLACVGAFQRKLSWRSGKRQRV